MGCLEGLGFRIVNSLRCRSFIYLSTWMEGRGWLVIGEEGGGRKREEEGVFKI